MKPTIANKPRGAIALLALLGISALVLMVMTTVAMLATGQAHSTVNATATEQTFFAAEAGLNQALYSLATNKLYSGGTTTASGITTTVTVTPDFPPTSTSFQGLVTVQASDSTGKVRIVKVRVTNSAFGGTITYGAQIDVGGITMAASDSTINGDVYSNGDVSGGGTINGNATVTDNSTIDQQSTVSTGEFPFGIHTGTTFYTDTAQSFVPGTSGTLNRFSLYLRRVGSNPPLLKWQIVANNGGKPATSYLRFGTIDSADVNTTPGWVNINVPTPLSVTAGVRYWLVLDTADSSGDHWVWEKDSTDGYVGGTGYYTTSWTSGSAIWTSVESDGADLNFETWVGSVYTSLSTTAVLGNASANNISATKVCGDASYFTITPTASSFLNSPGSPCPTPYTPGTGTVSGTLSAPKALPIGSTDISAWQNQIQTACGTGCISGNYAVGTNLNPTANAVTGSGLAASTTYYYRIAAVTGSIETIVSSEVKDSTTGTKKQIDLTWNKIGNATYHIYRTNTGLGGKGVYTSPALLSNPSYSCIATQCSFSDHGTPLISGTINCSDTCLGWQRINGALTIDSNLTLTGNVWVTGTVSVSSNKTAKIASDMPTQSIVLLTNSKVSSGNGANLCGSDCAATNPTNFLLVVSSDVDTGTSCSYSSGSPSIDAPNNSTGVIFAAPFGAVHVKKATVNASAARSLCLETQATVNFLSGISSLFIASPFTAPITSVPNSWQEQ